MKIAKKDLALIMIVVAVLVVFCAYRFSFASSMETVNQENTKQVALEGELQRLKNEAGTEPQKEKEIKDWQTEVEKIVEKYDSQYMYEDGILYVNDLETRNIAEINTYNVAETGVSATVAGLGAFSGKTYTQGTTTYSFSYKVDNYDALKKFLDELVSGNNGVKTLDSVSFSVDGGNGAVSGNVTLTVYVMSDGSAAYEPPVIDGVTNGITNIFGEIKVAPEAEK